VRNFRRNPLAVAILVSPALILYGIFFIVPVLQSMYYSLLNWNIVGAPEFSGLNNFVRLFTSDRVFLTSFRNTIFLVAIAWIAQQPMAILLAWILSRGVPGARFFKTVFFLPVVISSVAIGLLWSFVYHPDFGLVNSALRMVGLGHAARPWLGLPGTVLPAIGVAIGRQYVGYHMVLIFAGMQGIPSSVYDAVKIDGASEWQTFSRVPLPLIRPVLNVSAVLVVTGSIRVFDLIYVMTQGGPNNASEVLASYMFRRAFTNLNAGYGSAIAVSMVALSLVLTMIVRHLFSGESYELS
jgi:raffinose/stachyose/melibiose transport system permease protein